MSEAFRQRVFDILEKVPKGYVVTYGQIAKRLGNIRFSRAVGNALHSNNDVKKYPCYRVVNSKGCLAINYAFGGIEGQKRLLEMDGIEVINYQVDLKKYCFKLL